jgi:large subunit ribosomal protein L9
MATEVMLVRDVADLGSEGDVVRVADGYARNYLFPRKLAAPVTEATRRKLAKLQAERDARRKEVLREAQELANQLVNVSCTIPVKVGQADQMYGSVKAEDIVASLKSQGIQIDRHTIHLEEPIKEIGIFQVEVRLHPEVVTSIKVWVVEE